MASSWCPVLAAGRFDHFGFVRGGEVTQSNIQRLRPEASVRLKGAQKDTGASLPSLPPLLSGVCVFGGGIYRLGKG